MYPEKSRYEPLSVQALSKKAGRLLYHSQTAHIVVATGQVLTRLTYPLYLALH